MIHNGISIENVLLNNEGYILWFFIWQILNMLKNKTLSFGMSYVLNFIFINYWGKFKMLKVLI